MTFPHRGRNSTWNVRLPAAPSSELFQLPFMWPGIHACVHTSVGLYAPVSCLQGNNKRRGSWSPPPPSQKLQYLLCALLFLVSSPCLFPILLTACQSRFFFFFFGSAFSTKKKKMKTISLVDVSIHQRGFERNNRGTTPYVRFRVCCWRLLFLPCWLWLIKERGNYSN